MTADVMDQSTNAGQAPTGKSIEPEPTAAAPTGGAPTGGAPTGGAPTTPAASDEYTGAGKPLAANEIRGMRERIDEIDQAIIDLWLERARLSQEVGKTRMASGGTRLVLAREREIVERFRTALGPDGTQVALLLLRSGRGPL